MSETSTGETPAPATPSNWNLPNALTVGRLLMVPVFVFLAWVGFERESEAWQTWAAIVFGAARRDLRPGGPSSPDRAEIPPSGFRRDTFC